MNGLIRFLFPEAQVPSSPQTPALAPATSSEIIAALDQPLSPELQNRLEAMVESESRKLAYDYRASVEEKLGKSREMISALGEKLKSTREEFSNAVADLTRTDDGSIALAVPFLFFAIVCFAAEFALTFYTLPFILGVRDLYLRIAIAAAPTSALLILDRAFARILEGPWRDMRRNAAPRRWARRLVNFCMVFVLLTAVAGNVLTVVYLAQVREEVTRIFSAAESGAPTKKIVVDQGKVNRTVVAISLLVAIDGALLLTVGLAEVHQRQARRRAAAAVRKLRAQVDKTEVERTNALAVGARHERDRADADECAAILAENYRRTQAFAMGQAQDRLLSKLSLEQLVSGTLLREWEIPAEKWPSPEPPEPLTGLAAA